jgi:hypothetical protein
VPQGLATALQDRYRPDRQLGEGGMATVYLAHDLKLDRDVAIKVLRPELAAVLGRDRFLAEIHLTAKLDHPHILTLIDSGEVEAGPGGVGPFLYYVVPFIRGESLRQRLDRESQLPIDEALAIIRQVAGALDHAHRQGVIHRDLKPENILLQEGQAILADFGIALAVKEAGGPRLTETGLTLGTPLYMSPEQATAARQLDARSDIYSLGAVLYEMLAGEPPHTGATAQAVIARLMTTEAVPLRVLRSTVPESVERAVAKALSKTPADRFASAGEFAAALTAPVTNVAVPRISRRTVALGVAVIVLLAGVIWVAAHFQTQALRPRPVLKQITFSGNVGLAPAIAPDGKRVAYSERHCASSTPCVYAIVIQDLGSGERRTMVEGLPQDPPLLMWSPDQRFLLFSGLHGKNNRDYLVSTLGGGVHEIGCCGAEFVGSSDTLIQPVWDEKTSDTTKWFRLLATDGRWLDSIRVNIPGGNPWPRPSPDGRRLMIWNFITDDDQRFYLATRDGRLTDSLPILPGIHGMLARWSGTGDGVVMLGRSRKGSLSIGDLSGGVPMSLLRFRVDQRGRVALPPDTLAADLRLPFLGRLAPPDRAGTMALRLGQESHFTWTLIRHGTGSPSVARKVLSTTTSAVIRRISPDGRRFVLGRPVVLGTAEAVQLEVWSFDGDTGVAVGPPIRDLRGLGWSGDSRGLYYLAPSLTGGGTLGLTAIDPVTGVTRLLRTVPDSLPGLNLYDDGILGYRSGGGRLTGWQEGTPGEWTVLIPGDSVPHHFRFSDSTDLVLSTRASPDGQLFGLVTARLQYSPDTSTIFALYQARAGERTAAVTELPKALTTADYNFIRGGRNDALEMVRSDGEAHRWIRVEPGHPPKDIGPWPFTEWPSLSDDGTRGVANSTEDRTDLWLLTWPKP